MDVECTRPATTPFYEFWDALNRARRLFLGLAPADAAHAWKAWNQALDAKWGPT